MVGGQSGMFPASYVTLVDTKRWGKGGPKEQTWLRVNHYKYSINLSLMTFVTITVATVVDLVLRSFI